MHGFSINTQCSIAMLGLALSNRISVAMRQVQRKHDRATDGDPPPGSHCGGPEGGVWGCGGGERPHCGAVQSEDDSGVCGL